MNVWVIPNCFGVPWTWWKTTCKRFSIDWTPWKTWYMYSLWWFFITLRPSLQADKGPDEKDGQPEAQGAAGEEQERPADGGRQKTRGQPQRELPADQGKGGLWFFSLSPSEMGWLRVRRRWSSRGRKFLLSPPSDCPALNIVAITTMPHHNVTIVTGSSPRQCQTRWLSLFSHAHAGRLQLSGSALKGDN